MTKSPANIKGETATTAKAATAASATSASQESEAKTHGGGCHCGKVRYEMTSDVSKVVVCNCSICMKSGSLLTFIPATQFKLISGEEDLIDYQFNKHAIHHMVCPKCGIKSFAKATNPDGVPSVAVNVRCLDDIDLKALTVIEFDGRSR
jgi:hypothetical protein